MHPFIHLLICCVSLRTRVLWSIFATSWYIRYVCIPSKPHHRIIIGVAVFLIVDCANDAHKYPSWNTQPHNQQTIIIIDTTPHKDSNNSRVHHIAFAIPFLLPSRRSPSLLHLRQDTLLDRAGGMNAACLGTLRCTPPCKSLYVFMYNILYQ